MRTCGLLLLSTLLFSAVALSQTSASLPKKLISAPEKESKKAISPAAELALDAARRWTQTALEDASNLPPIERDIFFVRVANVWNGIDHAKAEEYLQTALEHLQADPSTASSSSHVGTSEAIGIISSDVMAVDRGAWNRLVEKLPSSNASDAIATEAATLAQNNDPQGAMELERKSLEHGGSESDLETLYSLILGKNQSAASKLFDEILKTSANPESNPELLSAFLRRLNDQGNDEINSFFDQERRQRLAKVVAQQTLSGNQKEACSFSFEAGPLMSQYDPEMQGQLQGIVDNCNRQGAYGPTNGTGTTLDKTDDLVRAMNEATDVKVKAGLRGRAAEHAAEDGNYERAIQLLMEASPEERQGEAFPFNHFDNRAQSLAWHAVSSALLKHDDLEFQRILAVLPPGLKADVELKAIELVSLKNLSPKDKVQSLLLLSDARNLLEQEVPPHTIAYFTMLRETVQLAPEDLNVSWRIVGKGLNRFAQQVNAQTTTASGVRSPQTPAYVNPIYPWFVPQRTLADEGLVRAIVGDLISPEFRACLRLSVIQAFLSSYTEALKAPPKHVGS